MVAKKKKDGLVTRGQVLQVVEVCWGDTPVPHESAEARKEAWNKLFRAMRCTCFGIAQAATWLAGELARLDNAPLLGDTAVFEMEARKARTPKEAKTPPKKVKEGADKPRKPKRPAFKSKKSLEEHVAKEPRPARLQLPPLPEREKLNDMTNDLKATAAVLWPEIDSQVWYAVAKSVQDKVFDFDFRFRRRILCSAGIPAFTNPQPIPIPATQYEYRECGELEDAEGKPLRNRYFWFRVPVMRNQKVWLRLAGGSGWASKNFWRQNGAIVKALQLKSEGVAGCGLGAASLYFKPRVGNRDVFLKIATTLPVTEQPGDRTIAVCTAPNALLVAGLVDRKVDATKPGSETLLDILNGLFQNRKPWIENGDNLRRREAAHAAYLQRFSEDTKYEKRWPRKVKKNMNRARELRCQKHHNYRTDQCHKITTSVVEYAKRNKCGTMYYDDKLRTYLKDFCWFQIKEMLKQKCQEAKITFVSLNDEEEESGETVPTTDGE